MTTTTMTHKEKVQDFLSQKRIAVTGLSRTKDSGAGAVYLKLRDNGYQVFAVHPSAESLLGDRCYPSLSAIPGGVDAVFIMNKPSVTDTIVDEAIKLGIKRVWMHNNTLMGSSASQPAVDRCQAANVKVISVGCPMMLLKADFFHKGMGWFLGATGRLK